MRPINKKSLNMLIAHSRVIYVISNLNNKECHLKSIENLINNFKCLYITTNNIAFNIYYQSILNKFNELKLKFIKMNKTKTQISYFIELPEEASIIRVIGSESTRSQKYHVLREYTNAERTEYLGLYTEEQIAKEFLIEIEYLDIMKLAKKFPNDADLGNKLRRFINNLGI